MANKKKMVDRVKYFCLIEHAPNKAAALEKRINEWLEESPDVQVVQVCLSERFLSAFIHYRTRA